MPTNYTKAYEKIAIQAYCKTIPDIDDAKITFPDPPDCLIELKTGDTTWIEVSSIYRSTELAKNLNSRPIGEVHTEFLGPNCQHRGKHVSMIFDAVQKKDGKANYTEFTQKYGPGILILYIDDPVASGDDLHIIIQTTSQKLKNQKTCLNNFHSVFLYVCPTATYPSDTTFIEGLFLISATC